MLNLIFDNADIFFIVILSMLCIYNVCFIKDLLFRFLLFFTTIFVSIINYSFILHKQEYFLIITFLNTFFISIIILLLIYSKKNSSILESNLKTVYNRQAVSAIVATFVIIVLAFSYVFTHLNGNQKDVPQKSELIINKKIYIKKDKNNTDIKNEVINQITGKTDYYYIIKYKDLDNSVILLKYNSIIILYMAYIVGMYFLSKMYNKNEG